MAYRAVSTDLLHFGVKVLLGSEQLPTRELAISQDAAYIIFSIWFGVCFLGLVAVLYYLITRLRAQPAKKRNEESIATESAWENILLPATITDDDTSLAPEVAAALEELDRYSEGATLSPVPSIPSHSSVESPASPLELRTSPSQDPNWRAQDTAVRRDALAGWLTLATPNDVEMLMKEGIRLARAGRKAEAYDIFATITRLVPDHFEAWLWKGGVALHPEDAVRCLQKAIELNPEDTRARQGLTWALSQLSERENPPDEPASM